MVVADVRVYRDGIAANIAQHDAFTVVCAATGCADAAQQLARVAPHHVDDLIETIRSVSRGELLCSPRIASSLVRALRVQPPKPGADHLAVMLTAREQQIVPLLDRGLSTKEIAAALHIEVTTVKNHMHNLLEQLHVASRGEAAARLRGASGLNMGRRRSDIPPRPRGDRRVTRPMMQKTPALSTLERDRRSVRNGDWLCRRDAFDECRWFSSLRHELRHKSLSF